MIKAINQIKNIDDSKSVMLGKWRGKKKKKKKKQKKKTKKKKKQKKKKLKKIK